MRLQRPGHYSPTVNDILTVSNLNPVTIRVVLDPTIHRAVTLSHQAIEDLAPDQASLTAARKLLKPAKWPVLHRGPGDALIWGECQGSGSTPYRVCVSVPDHGYKCTCPSRKFPCKHSLALMWFWVDDAERFVADEVPQWVHDWMGRRRGPQAPAAAKQNDTTDAAPPQPNKSLAAADATSRAPAPPIDPEAEAKTAARSAAARARNRAKRETQIQAGLNELETWLIDVLRGGLAGFPSRSIEQCALIAKRLNDAKAPALATRVLELSALTRTTQGDDQVNGLLQGLSELHLIVEAYRRQEELPPGLRADARAAVGWTLERDVLLNDPTLARATGSWMVVGERSIVQVDSLRRTETWFLRIDGATPKSDPEQFAVLLDFSPVSLGTRGTSRPAGEIRPGTMVYYPSAAPLRAVFLPSDGSPASTADAADAPRQLPADAPLAQQFDAVDRARAAVPWLRSLPIAASDLQVKRTAAGTLWLCDAKGSTGRPLPSDEFDQLFPLVGRAPFRGAGVHDGQVVDLLYAETDLGAWSKV